MSNPDAPATTGANDSFTEDLRSCWRRLPGRELFFPALLVWIVFFHFLGNSTLGYSKSPSLFRWMFTAYTTESPVGDDAHGLVIPFVVLGLLWWKRERLLKCNLRLWWPALFLLVVATALHLLGYLVQQPRISIVAFFGGVFALAGLAWGPGLLANIFYPFVLFAFMVPLGSFTETVTVPLRHVVTKLVVFISHNILGLDVISIGTHLINPSLQYEYEIAVPCSGMRSLVAITLLALVYATIFLRGFWPRVVMVATALPLAVIGNTFRMMVIILAAQIGGEDLGKAAHDNAFFSMLPYVPAIFGVLWLGRLFEHRQIAPVVVVEKLDCPA